jgi:hypothetical protein
MLAPSPPVTVKAVASTSNGSSKAEEDRRKMPPPSSLPRPKPPSKLLANDVVGTRNGKGKEKAREVEDVVEILDSDNEEEPPRRSEPSELPILPEEHGIHMV